VNSAIEKKTGLATLEEARKNINPQTLQTVSLVNDIVLYQLPIWL
jgi:hypothetical protein